MDSMWVVCGLVRLSAFTKWRKKLDANHRGMVDSRMIQVEHGYVGSFNNLKKSLYELKWDSALRVYFSRIDYKIVLIFGSNKKSKQSRAIKKSRRYLKEYIRGDLT